MWQLAKVTGTHFLFIDHILLQDGESGVILQCDVEGLTTTCLNKIEQGLGVTSYHPYVVHPNVEYSWSDNMLPVLIWKFLNERSSCSRQGQRC